MGNKESIIDRQKKVNTMDEHSSIHCPTPVGREAKENQEQVASPSQANVDTHTHTHTDTLEEFSKTN